MNRDPVIFACANPVPEIFPDEAKAAGAAVVSTGRSDYPNQINNVLAFPGIFRGALDVRASDINEEMKKALEKKFKDIEMEYHPVTIKVYGHREDVFNFLKDNIDTDKFDIKYDKDWEFKPIIRVSDKNTSPMQYAKNCFIRNNRGRFY